MREEEIKYPYYFVGEYGQAPHYAPPEYVSSGYPVFSTYNKENPKERHSQAIFVHREDAGSWAEHKNNSTNN